MSNAEDYHLTAKNFFGFDLHVLNMLIAIIKQSGWTSVNQKFIIYLEEAGREREEIIYI